MILIIFFVAAVGMIVISSRRLPKEAYILAVSKKIFYPLMLSVVAIILSAVLIGLPLEGFAAYMGCLPLIFVMALALEALI